jgi:tetratricopeptide (TPR) repeat protein
MTRYLALLALATLVSAETGTGQGATGRVGLVIVNGVSRPSHGQTNVDAGESEGNMLNVHYFPGLLDYGATLYGSAESQMSYVIDRPHYLKNNPRRAEFMGMAHYIRGVIYLYHADGVGRYALAKADFESAIKWNPRNYVAYLELSRVYSQLEMKDTAVSVLRLLLDLKPEQAIETETLAELKKLGAAPRQ